MANSRNPIHVLVIEDDPEDFQFLKDLLRRESAQSFRLTQEETLEEGMAFLDMDPLERGHPIDVVLLDLGLPDCTPEQTASIFWKYAYKYPTVVITGQAADMVEGFNHEALAMGAEDFLSKPEINTSSVLSRVIRNAIQRKELKQELEQAQELAGIGSWSLDLSSNQLHCSDYMSTIFELELSQSLDSMGQYLALVHYEDQESIAQALKEACIAHAPLSIDHRILLPDGKIKYASLRGHIKKSPQGIPLQVIGTTQDITDRKKLESLQREKDLAEKSARIRQDFLTRTSHEIRTPLNPILVLTSMLQQTPLTEEQREYMEIIQNAGETLLALVNDILDLAKIEAGKISFERQPFRLERVMESISDMMEIKARERNLRLLLHLDPRLDCQLLGDNVRLLQILLNLVGNAIKFTKKGQIVVNARPVYETDKEIRVKFTVQDTGIGIPESKLQTIFDSFQQVGNPTHASEGVGLGLSIVRQLVHLQHGTLSVKSQQGKGSVFTFELNFQRTQKRISSTKRPITNPGLNLSRVANLRILLVEDHPLNQLVTQKLLTEWGTQVVIANNGLEAIEALRKESFDLVLMDIQMPEMDGYEATRFIRAEMPPPIDEIPIIALTANAFLGSDDECLKVGMNDYLSKPIEIQNLFDKIVAHVPAKRGFTQGPQQPVNGYKEVVTRKSKVLAGSTIHSLTSITSGNMNSYQYINLQPLQDLMNGDTDLMKQVIQVFVQETPDIMSSLKSYLAQGQFDSISKLAHRLKSSAGHIGMDALYQVSFDLEQKSKSDPNQGEISLLVGEADSLLNGGLGELRDALGRM